MVHLPLPGRNLKCVGMMMAVSFKRSGRLHYLDPGRWRPVVGDKVLVPTQAGHEVAECIWAPQWIDDDIDGLPVCAGPASQADLERDESNRAKRAEARVLAKRLARELKLPMKIIAADYLSETGLLIIYFGAPDRVDFRALARELTTRLRAKVELRQVGPREEAKLQGGIGPCGRDLCCATFLREFEPVSIRMAKDQDLPVNPMRIAGACGRLMCCLKYEHPLYLDFKERAPKLGADVDSPEGAGTVVGYSVPADKVIVKVAETGQRCACPRASVCGSRQEYEAMHAPAREGADDR
jgi:cell fate regulator YaaT (PSP1 superfamily)